MLYFDLIFSVTYFIAELLIFVFKSYNLTYPPLAIDPEVASLFFYFFIQMQRISTGRRGNRTETSGYITFFQLLSVFVILAYCYNIVLQTFVLVIEIILNGFGLLIVFLEMIFMVLSLGGISEQEKNL